MPAIVPNIVHHRRGRTAVSGKQILLILALSLLALGTILYIAIVRLKLAGPDALRIRPAPATGAAPSQ